LCRLPVSTFKLFVCATFISPRKVSIKHDLSRRQGADSSPCWGDFNIVSQADIDNGILAHCTILHGDIILDNATGNVSLSFGGGELGLAVNGSVYCRNNSELNGLDTYAVYNVSGTFAVQNATSLHYLETDFDAAGAFEVQNCPNLNDASFFVTTITESLVIEGNSSPGLDVLTTIGRVNNITIRNVAGLSMPGLREVYDSFEISYCDNLISVNIQSLQFVGGSFYIQNNPTLQLLQLDEIQTIGNSLEITNNSMFIFNQTTFDTPEVQSSLQNVATMQLSGPFRSL